MSKLRISTDLALPPEAVTETFAILAKRGVGKTYTASVMVEELLKAGLHTVVADPIGVWWGLRSSADGKGPGLPITILGGDHGDLPLEVAAGAVVADLVVDEAISVVLDLSGFRKGEQVRFMTEFAERLYHRNRAPLHLVLDEADAFAPQRPMKGQERMLGAVEDLQRRGRARGLGVTLVTQRSAVLNKDVLTQAEVLIALRTIAPQDREAIDAWIKVHGTPEQRDDLMRSLPSLPVGTAWFWSPGWLNIFKRVRVRRRETFDSSATPKAGARRVQPRVLADVDLEAVRRKMAATIERAKSEDPKELRRRIAELERQVQKAQRIVQPEPVLERVEVPVLPNGQTEALLAVTRKLEVVVKEVADVARDIVAMVGAVREPVRAPGQPGSEPRRLAPPKSAVASPAPAQAGALPGSRQRILDALAFLESIGVGAANKTQLALLADQSPKSSGYTNNLGSLRTAGLIDYPGPGTVALTEEGRPLGDAGDVPRTDTELHELIFSKLGGARSRILAVLIDEHPKALAKDDLAERAGQSPTSSGYTNNLGSLRSLGLIDYPVPGHVVACSVLFLGSR